MSLEGCFVILSHSRKQLSPAPIHQLATIHCAQQKMDRNCPHGHPTACGERSLHYLIALCMLCTMQDRTYLAGQFGAAFRGLVALESVVVTQSIGSNPGKHSLHVPTQLPTSAHLLMSLNHNIGQSLASKPLRIARLFTCSDSSRSMMQLALNFRLTF